MTTRRRPSPRVAAALALTALAALLPIAAGAAPASAAPTGRITGTVTSARTGAPLMGICAVAVPPPLGGTSTEHPATSPTGATGTYVIDALDSGSYRVRFEDCTGSGFGVGRSYGGRDGIPPDVTVTTGVTTAHIDVALDEGGRIRGTVRAAASGAPVGSACVHVATGILDEPLCATSAPDGTYELRGVPVGSRTLFTTDSVVPARFAGQYHDGATSSAAATPVTVVAGATLTGVDISLVAGGHLWGTVTTGDTHQPLTGACVSASSSAGELLPRQVTTGANGTFDLAGLAAGSYTVAFSDCSADPHYLRRWSGNASSAAAAEHISVGAGGTVDGVDAVLPVGGRRSEPSTRTREVNRSPGSACPPTSRAATMRPPRPSTAPSS